MDELCDWCGSNDTDSKQEDDCRGYQQHKLARTVGRRRSEGKHRADEDRRLREIIGPEDDKADQDNQ